MADRELLKILLRGPEAWNEWRAKNPSNTHFDLDSTPELQHMNLSGANFSGVRLRWNPMLGNDFSGCDFRGADLMGSNLRGSNCTKADFTGADLQWVHFTDTNLRGAILCDTLLKGSTFLRTDARGAIFTGSKVFGVSVWSIETDENTEQSNLLITSEEQPAVTVDDIEVAQFVYLLLNREKLRDVLNTITTKAVLILGRFTPEKRKRILDGIANKLRTEKLVPIIFDFDRPTDRDFTETIKTLAGLCIFVIADITNPKSAPLELQALVPDYQIPFVTILQEGEKCFSMFKDLWTKYRAWMLPPVTYPSLEGLMRIFDKAVLARALKKREVLRRTKAEDVPILDWRDFDVSKKRRKAKAAAG